MKVMRAVPIATQCRVAESLPSDSLLRLTLKEQT
jgi:hypothetical protein